MTMSLGLCLCLSICLSLSLCPLPPLQIYIQSHVIRHLSMHSTVKLLNHTQWPITAANLPHYLTQNLSKRCYILKQALYSWIWILYHNHTNCLIHFQGNTIPHLQKQNKKIGIMMAYINILHQLAPDHQISQVPPEQSLEVIQNKP